MYEYFEDLEFTIYFQEDKKNRLNYDLRSQLAEAQL